MIIRPGLGALDGVMANLSRQTRDEAKSAGIPAQELRQRLIVFYWAPRVAAHSFYCNGQASAVLAVRENIRGGETFLIAADGFFEESVRHRRFLKDHMTGLFEWFGPIQTRTFSEHPHMGRWLKLLGYAPHPTIENLYRWG